MDLVEAWRLWEVHQWWQEKCEKLRERGTAGGHKDDVKSRLLARACGSWCWQVDRRTSEKIVEIAFLGSDAKGNAMWHMPQIDSYDPRKWVIDSGVSNSPRFKSESYSIFIFTMIVYKTKVYINEHYAVSISICLTQIASEETRLTLLGKCTTFVR